MTRRPKSANILIKAFLALVSESDASRAFITQAAADAVLFFYFSFFLFF